MPELDILYMTRVQRERFFNEEDYIRLKDRYILDAEKMTYAKDDMLVLHPPPRVNEISVEVDKDPRAAYFRQVQSGVYGSDGLDYETFGGGAMLNISGINEGYVIDHIQAGKSMEIYKYLQLGKLDCQVAIIKNASSNKDGKKIL